jgi:hypothetical protein
VIIIIRLFTPPLGDIQILFLGKGNYHGFDELRLDLINLDPVEGLRLTHQGTHPTCKNKIHLHETDKRR